MIKNLLEEDLKKSLNKLGLPSSDIVLSISDNPHFGDYTTNIALQQSNQKSKKSYHSPIDIANEIVGKLGHPSYLERVEIAGPGFINFWIKDGELIKSVIQHSSVIPAKAGIYKDRSPIRSGMTSASMSKEKKKYLIEYGHVNILKEIHIGHLRTFVLGESLCRILEYLGHKVFRANYQGDIGLHVAKAVYGIEKLGWPKGDLSLEEKAEFLGQAYAQGNTDYEDDPEIKRKIHHINTSLYQKDSDFMADYGKARKWSLEYFEPIYKKLGVKYDRCFFESEVAEEGKMLVLENVGKVFKEDNRAIIFSGEQYGFHTRVFITQAGHPTYEGKEIGLAKLEHDSFDYDKSIHVVASEQEGYFEVVIKAVEMVFPKLKGKKYHLSYGLVDLKEGKMSSRSGNVITVDELIKLVSDQILENLKETRIAIAKSNLEAIALGAIKFSFLKFAPNTNVVFDLGASVSLQGDSGPYLQYTFARTQSLLKHETATSVQSSEFRVQSEEATNHKLITTNYVIEPEERNLLRQIEFFEVIAEKAAQEYHPNLICAYLIELAKAFNLFYQLHPILKSKHSGFRLALVSKVAETLKTGLHLLGIEALEKM